MLEIENEPLALGPGVFFLPDFARPLSYSLPVHHLAPIHMKNLARHIRRVVRGQEDIAGRQFFRLSGPLHRRVRPKRGYLLLRERRRNKRRPDRAGRDAIYPYPLLDQSLRERPGEGHYRPLGRGIIEKLGATLISCNRGGVYYSAPLCQML